MEKLVSAEVTRWSHISLRYGKVSSGIRNQYLLSGTTIVNAHIVYQTATNKKNTDKKISGNSRFRMVRCVIGKILCPTNIGKNEEGSHHLEIRKNQQGKPIRRMCTLCYEKKRQIVARQEARKNVKKTKTYCSKCPKSPQMCLECFNDII